MRPPFASLLQTTAVSVATILGTGILGLPVSLHASGLRPFLLTFTLTLFAQLGVVIAAVELLQRAHVSDPGDRDSTYTALPSESASALPVVDAAPPSLHSLGRRFLPARPARFVFNILVLLHFLFLLSAYALAGPQALSALFSALRILPPWLLPTVFVVSLALAVALFPVRLLAPLTAATAAKALLLTALVVAVLVRGLVIRQHPIDAWRPHALVDPFLMGSFALNGVVNLMPVTFQTCLDAAKAEHGPAHAVDFAFVQAYRTATIIAVCICYALNVAWCVAVLLCVPQGEAVVRSLVPVAEHSNSILHAAPAFLTAALPPLQSNATLGAASQAGQISTIPLIEVLQARGDPLDWVVSFLVNLFISLSITVSFLVMSIGMKHFIDGGARSQLTASAISYDLNRWWKYIAAYTVVLSTAVTNPKALLQIMEGVAALCLNLEAGVFVVYMFYVCRTMAKPIPAPLSQGLSAALICLVGLFFSLAVLIDVLFYIPKMFK